MGRRWGIRGGRTVIAAREHLHIDRHCCVLHDVCVYEKGTQGRRRCVFFTDPRFVRHGLGAAKWGAVQHEYDAGTYQRDAVAGLSHLKNCVCESRLF